MQIDVEKLDEILSEELRLFDELVRASSETTTRILHGDLDGLVEVTRRQNELIMAAAEAGKLRSVFQRELSNGESEQTGEAETEPALRFVAEPHASRFADHDEKLRSTSDALRARSEDNRFLLAYSLHMVDRAMQLVCDTPETGGTYSSAGSCSDRSPSNSALLDRQG